MSTLYIDTRNNEGIIVRLTANNKEYTEESIAAIEKAQAALPMVQKVLKDARLKPSDIKEINVATGSGSFTGLRVGIAIANALSFSLQVKINGKNLSELENPQY